MKRTTWLVTAACLVTVPALAAPPETIRAPVTDEYHGVEVVDPYRWLEDWSDPAVRAWSDAQNVHCRELLVDLPHREEIRDRVEAILAAPIVSHFALRSAGDRLFAIRRQPPKQQPVLVVMDSADAPESARVLVDPEALDATGSTTIDWYEPSPDGTLVAVSLSSAGTERGDLHVFRTADGTAVGEVVPRVNGGTAGGSLVWDRDGRGFLYTRYPRPGARPDADLDFYVDVYHHTRGDDPADDRYEIGRAFPRIAEIELKREPGGDHVIATVQDGDGDDFAHFLRTPDGAWSEISPFGADVKQVEFGPGGRLYAISRAGAPRGKILEAPLRRPRLADAQILVREGADSIVTSFWGSPSLVATSDRIVVTYQTGGPSELRVFDLVGNPAAAPAPLPVSSVGGLTPLGDGRLLFSTSSYVRPRAWMRFDPHDGSTVQTALSEPAPVPTDDLTVVREFATSRDGTSVPVNIMMLRGTERDGANPCVVTGYGGYGVSLSPWFSALNRVLLEQGVVVAVANLRGGGEYGAAWHTQGNLTNKQNVFDDFQAVLEHVIARGYTAPARLGIMGGSNGGLLMGATFTQRPQLARAVVSAVGIYDMLRVELSPNGAFNVTEFGTVEDSEQFRALHAYSPYHHVREGVAYPSILFTTGATDPRVDPMQSRKMTALLQATGTRRPVLLRTSMDTGHGGGTPLRERIERSTDGFAFLCAELGVDYRRVAD